MCIDSSRLSVSRSKVLPATWGSLALLIGVIPSEKGLCITLGWWNSCKVCCRACFCAVYYDPAIMETQKETVNCDWWLAKANIWRRGNWTRRDGEHTTGSLRVPTYLLTCSQEPASLVWSCWADGWRNSAIKWSVEKLRQLLKSRACSIFASFRKCEK